MKQLLITIYLLLASIIAFSQSGDAMRKIEAARIALITERLELTPDQAEKFWPIYKEYADQRRELLQQMRNVRDRAGQRNLTEAEGKKLMQRAHELKQQEVTLDKRYADRMMSVISARQMMSLRKAEEDFRKILLRQLERRREQQMNRDKLRDRKQDMQQNRQGN